MQSLERRLDVDERVLRQHELDLRSPGQELGTHGAAQLREQHAQPRVVVGRRVLAVDGRQQLVAVHPTEPVEHEVGEEQPAVGTRQRVLDASPAQLHHEPAAELDSRPAPAIQPKVRKIGERFGKRWVATVADPAQRSAAT